MKKLFLAAILSVFVLSACGGQGESGSTDGVEGFSMEGSWTSESDQLIGPQEGYMEGTATVEVTETEGRTFEAEITYPSPEGDITEELVGSMTPDGNLMAGSKEDGTYTFKVVDEDTLDHCFTQTGDNYLTVCGRMTRD